MVVVSYFSSVIELFFILVDYKDYKVKTTLDPLTGFPVSFFFRRGILQKKKQRQQIKNKLLNDDFLPSRFLLNDTDSRARFHIVL